MLRETSPIYHFTKKRWRRNAMLSIWVTFTISCKSLCHYDNRFVEKPFQSLLAFNLLKIFCSILRMHHVIQSSTKLRRYARIKHYIIMETFMAHLLNTLTHLCWINILTIILTARTVRIFLWNISPIYSIRVLQCMLHAKDRKSLVSALRLIMYYYKS